MTLLSMNEITTYRWSLEEDVENYQEAGYSGIGVWRCKVADGDENQTIDLLNASGLKVTHLSWAGGFTGSDGRSAAESIVDALEALRLAAATITRFATPADCCGQRSTSCCPSLRRRKCRWRSSRCTRPVRRTGRF